MHEQSRHYESPTKLQIFGDLAKFTAKYGVAAALLIGGAGYALFGYPTECDAPEQYGLKVAPNYCPAPPVQPEPHDSIPNFK